MTRDLQGGCYYHTNVAANVAKYIQEIGTRNRLIAASDLMKATEYSNCNGISQ